MICPSCQKDQSVGEQNYGALYTCSSCQAVYFINFDGQPEYGEMGSQDLQSFEIPAQPEGLSNLNTDFQQGLTDLDSVEPLIDSQNVLDNISYEKPLDEALPTDSMNSLENPFESQNNMSAMNSDFQLDNSFDLPQEAEVAVAVAAQVVATAAPTQSKAAAVARKAAVSGAFTDIAQEISDFGNTDAQLASLNYDLIVSGIDTQETKNLFKEAIEDSKFAWDAFEIMKSVKNGRVEIKKLSPAKAYLLAKRIQFLDIEKVWKQNVLM